MDRQNIPSPLSGPGRVALQESWQPLPLSGLDGRKRGGSWRLKAWICLYKVMNTVCTMFHHPLRENICTYNLIYIYINLLGGVTFFIRIELQQIPGGASRMLVSNLTQSFFFQKLPWKNTHTTDIWRMDSACKWWALENPSPASTYDYCGVSLLNFRGYISKCWNIVGYGEVNLDLVIVILLVRTLHSQPSKKHRAANKKLPMSSKAVQLF